MGSFFSADSGFSRFMSRLFDLLVLNLVFLVSCIPIVTIGPAITAMYYVTLKMARNQEGYLIRSYLKSFKENFRQALCIWLIILFVSIALVVDFMWAGKLENATLNFVLRVLFGMFLFIDAMLFGYVFSVLAKFVNSIGQTMKNALIMAILNLKFTFPILILVLLPFILAYIGPRVFAAALFFYLFMGYSLTAWVNSLMFVRIFDKYIKSEDEAETELETDRKKE